ncbi:MAG TPA: hypothetical protein VI854_02045, partial [Acidimicrobiia bacterium]|nr:hypothetical protein [Acidimicrobiia bacterium]
RLAVNSILLGAPPSRLRPWHARRAVEVACDGRPGAGRAATSVAVLTGQYVGGLDLNPRSHPGDGSVEVQVYGLPAGERRAMRRRLPSGSHLPHPGITTARAARRVWVRFDRDVAVELDGVPAGRAATLDIEVLAGAFRLVV